MCATQLGSVHYLTGSGTLFDWSPVHYSTKVRYTIQLESSTLFARVWGIDLFIDSKQCIHCVLQLCYSYLLSNIIMRLPNGNYHKYIGCTSAIKFYLRLKMSLVSTMLVK